MPDIKMRGHSVSVGEDKDGDEVIRVNVRFDKFDTESQALQFVDHLGTLLDEFNGQAKITKYAQKLGETQGTK